MSHVYYGRRNPRNTCPSCGHNVLFTPPEGMDRCPNCCWRKHPQDPTLPRWWNYTDEQWVPGHPSDPAVAVWMPDLTGEQEPATLARFAA